MPAHWIDLIPASLYIDTKTPLDGDPLPTATTDPKMPFAKGSQRPILLKKSAMVCASEKYAFDIEIFTFGRGFWTWISRSSVQKRRFHQSMIRQFGQTDFFNRIGQKLSFRCAYEFEGDSTRTLVY
ncbi:hypothetical protein HK44_016440 [Pseudomonas fluorescens HK44]|uniref:Uncharacterized protein n=2 Tax=Pseudomonas fluorescens TaxID=294 RepID=A0A010SUV0_PSEFL|nr:hypothetical protein HK44_016440 [Pseudomonas fluorescens HK44]